MQYDISLCFLAVVSFLIISALNHGFLDQSMAANKKKIDINKATCEDFESLIGIGHAKAEAIIEARQVSEEWK